AVGGSTSTISGLQIKNFSGSGIRLDGHGNHVEGIDFLNNGGPGVTVTGNSNVIGGTTADARNLIRGNFGAGIDIQGPAMNTSVQGNLIGTTATGIAVNGNVREGVLIESGALSTIIGGLTTTARNVISGNSRDGVAIKDGTTTGTVVQGNFIGT